MIGGRALELGPAISRMTKNTLKKEKLEYNVFFLQLKLNMSLSYLFMLLHGGIKFLR